MACADARIVIRKDDFHRYDLPQDCIGLFGEPQAAIGAALFREQKKDVRSN